MTNGLARPDAHIAIPISPRVLFLAAKTNAVADNILTQSSDQIVRTVNDRIAKQAVRYVYGVDDTQLRFVENRSERRFHRPHWGIEERECSKKAARSSQ
jgi:hypothetical protein